MRVLLLSHEPFYPPSGGGSSEAPYFVRALVDRGHTVEVFTPTPRAPVPDFGPRCRLHAFTALDIHRHTAARLPKYLAWPFFLQRMLTAYLRRETADVILAQHTLSAVAAGRVARRAGLPFVMNLLDCLTGYFELWPAWTGAPLWARPVTEWELQSPRRLGAAGVLTISDTLRDAVVQRGYPADAVLPIYYGVDEDVFRPDPDAALPAAPVVIMHGSFDHHHLGAIAAETLRTVCRQRPETTFRFVGPLTPSLKALQQAAAAAGFARNVECTGFVPYAEVGRHLRAATVGMIPYAHSQGGRFTVVSKAIEYAACGLPFVATEMEGTQRFFQGCPLAAFAKFDGAALGQQLLEWLDRAADLRRREGVAAANDLRARQGWTAVGRRVVDFLEATVAARAGAARSPAG